MPRDRRPALAGLSLDLELPPVWAMRGAPGSMNRSGPSRRDVNPKVPAVNPKVPASGKEVGKPCHLLAIEAPMRSLFREMHIGFSPS